MLRVLNRNVSLCSEVGNQIFYPNNIPNCLEAIHKINIFTAVVLNLNICS